MLAHRMKRSENKGRLVADDIDRVPCGQVFLDQCQPRLDRIDYVDHVRARLAAHLEQERGSVVQSASGQFIFLAVFFGTLAFAFVEPFFFIGYLVSIALFGLFQAIFMANAGGAWDNAKKVVEVSLKEKGTPLHDATVVGDTVGDPFKDTSSVAMNPVIKFTTLFGLLAVELAVSLARQQGPGLTSVLAGLFFLVSMGFVWRSFYGMRITGTASAERKAASEAAPQRVRATGTGTSK